MARTGILYPDVVKAAALVAADGKNPTVDNVRVALGGTGSKSTIAPLLKRWKDEQRETPIETGLGGLPAELVEAMKSLYQKLQLDVGRQLEQARAEHRAAMQTASEQVRQAEAERMALAGVKAALSVELGATQAALAQLKEEHHFRAVTLATLHSDNAGLNQRLADRAAEVTALNQQLTQARLQFEHDQEAGAVQRMEERQAAEQRLSRVEQDLAAAQQHLRAQQAAIAQQEMQIAQLHGENGRLLAAVALAQDELAQLRPEREQLAYQFKEASTVGQALAAKLDTARQALTQSRMALAAQEKQAEMLAAGLDQAVAREEKLARERWTLIQENATFQAQAQARNRRDGAAR